VQKDLIRLWDVNLNGKVNGAVETCGESFHRFDTYLIFSNPHIARNFDPNPCGWAYGMNIFDLKEWKKKDITGIYHKWQNMVRIQFLLLNCMIYKKKGFGNLYIII
jgi:alpha-1,4-galacturonosyltransferase